VKGDGPMTLQRRWFKQFYDENSSVRVDVSAALDW
jgi:hypothetical protein